ncbi:hypothetical protein EV421DRAFT_1362222 [Armillaria borealis]|uniref:Uncharacterized protein n=1 Tax=Armillaria borealis TaxID=47425 RepID=A0AA39J0P7_9AGAR|nr:hypothetical protein EV421DRAFT_1362222 [Armillaria borealis]
MEPAAVGPSHPLGAIIDELWHGRTKPELRSASMSLLVSGERLPWREIDAGRINVEDDDGDNLATLSPEYEEISSNLILEALHRMKANLSVPVVNFRYHIYPRSAGSDISIQFHISWNTIYTHRSAGKRAIRFSSDRLASSRDLIMSVAALFGCRNMERNTRNVKKMPQDIIRFHGSSAVPYY